MKAVILAGGLGTRLRSGNMKKAHFTSDFARGIDNPTIDSVLMSDDINQEFLVRLANKT